MKQKQWGRVITVTSVFGMMGGGRPWFNVAKAAQTTLMKNFALNKSFTQNGITFNSVAPGSIMIENTGWEKELNDDPEKFQTFVKNSFPLGRLGTPEEVADLVVFSHLFALV